MIDNLKKQTLNKRLISKLHYFPFSLFLLREVHIEAKKKN